MPFLCKAHVQYALILVCKCCNYMDTSPQHVSFGRSREHQVVPNVSCECARLLLPVGSQISTDIHATYCCLLCKGKLTKNPAFYKTLEELTRHRT